MLRRRRDRARARTVNYGLRSVTIEAGGLAARAVSRRSPPAKEAPRSPPTKPTARTFREKASITAHTDGAEEAADPREVQQLHVPGAAAIQRARRRRTEVMGGG